MARLFFLNRVLKALPLFILFCVSVAGQKPLSENAKQIVSWRQRTADITQGIQNDKSWVPNFERPLYLALLAKMWWKLEPENARRYLRQSADGLVDYWKTNDVDDIEKPLRFCQKTIQIVTQLDQQLGQSVTSQIVKSLQKKGKKDRSISDTLIFLGRQVVKDSPQLAYDLAVSSLNFGNSPNLAILVTEIVSKDPVLGERLYFVALTAAKQTYSYEFIGSLGAFVFDSFKGATYSDRAKQSYLELLLGILLTANANELNRSNCEISALAAPVLNRYDEYLPSQAPLAHQLLQFCVGFSTASTSEITKAQSNGEEPTSAEEFIRAARDTRDEPKKVHYFHRAINKFVEEKRYGEIISFLDSMSTDEIKAIGRPIWDDFRSEFAFRLALICYENKDLAGVYDALNRTPKSIRPYTRFRLVNKLTPEIDREFYLENLVDIRNELMSLEIPAKYAAGSFLTLTRISLKSQPTEAGGIFRDAVKYINKADTENANFVPEEDYAPLEDVVKLPSELLELDEIATLNSLSDVSSPRSRIRLRLGLLESSLKKLAEFNSKVAVEKIETLQRRKQWDKP
jgi:hypothetical protein